MYLGGGLNARGRGEKLSNEAIGSLNWVIEIADTGGTRTDDRTVT